MLSSNCASVEVATAAPFLPAVTFTPANKVVDAQLLAARAIYISVIVEPAKLVMVVAADAASSVVVALGEIIEQATVEVADIACR